MLNSIWTLCKANYIKLKIVPLWTGMNLVPEVNIVPNEKWIAEPNSNMLQKIFEKNVFPDGGKDTATMENEEIVEQIQKYDYITPNDCHPNKSGHYAIAKYIINILDKKI